MMDFCSSEYFSKSIIDHVAKITVPVLFIRGNNDPMVSSQDFDQMFKVTQSFRVSKKACFRTPFHHSNSFGYEKGGRGRYMFVWKKFVEQDFETFLETLQTTN